jgi:hypothetical protein
MKNKQIISHYISFSAIPLGIVWFIMEPSIEPVLAILFGINSIIGLGLPWNNRKYESKRNKGTISFNFNKNGNKYSLGKDETFFETQWSSSSESSILAYARTPSLKGAAVVSDVANISDISNASEYEYTDYERPQTGEILLLINRYGNYAALKIIDVQDRTRGSDEDKVTIEYVLNPEGVEDFR